MILNYLKYYFNAESKPWGDSIYIYKLLSEYLRLPEIEEKEDFNNSFIGNCSANHNLNIEDDALGIEYFHQMGMGVSIHYILYRMAYWISHL